MSNPARRSDVAGFDATARRFFVDALRALLGLEPLADKTNVFLAGDERAREFTRRGAAAARRAR